MDKIDAYFNYRNPLKEGELKPAFGLQEEDPLMPNHTSYKKTIQNARLKAVSYTHLRAHETAIDLVCRLLLEKIFF